MKAQLLKKTHAVAHMLTTKMARRAQEARAARLKESVHVASAAPAGRMATVPDASFVSDPAQMDGIEINDEVALVSAPDMPIGILIGITGRRSGLVRNEAGSINEYPSGSLKLYRDAGATTPA